MDRQYWEDKVREVGLFLLDRQELTLESYHDYTSLTAEYPEDAEIVYLTLGLAGEAGEVANKVKKSIRDNSGMISNELRNSLLYELGDCFWYLVRLCVALGFRPSEVLISNLSKLFRRKITKSIQGSGDYRGVG